MKVIFGFLLLFSSSAMSQTALSPDTLLDRLAGTWVMRGTMAGQQTTHDVHAEWVLARQYLQLHEVSREKDSTGHPAYEAIVIVAWDKKQQQYGCLWLDITGLWNFSGDGIGHAKPAGNEIPFLFKTPGGNFHNTFAYDEKSNSWRWALDDEDKGKIVPFARVTLTRE